MKDIPASLGGLAHGAAAALPPGAVHLPNDLGIEGYAGPNPPPGTGTHRLFVAVTALAVETLEVPAGASSALVQIVMLPHTLGRAVLVGTSQAAPA